MGFALWVAQQGGRPAQAKPLKGITPGAGVLELVERHDGDAYRVVLHRAIRLHRLRASRVPEEVTSWEGDTSA